MSRTVVIPLPEATDKNHGCRLVRLCTGEVKMKIGETRNQELPGGVDDLCVLRRLHRPGRCDRLNLFVSDNHGHVGPWICASSVNYRNVSDHKTP